MDEKNAIIISDSISNGNRITSYLLTVPQIIVKELLRHRMFSFSSSSMRAIPFNKVLGDIRENMFVPLAFQSHHSGMQGSEYLMGEESEKAKQQWIESGLRVCEEAERLYNLGVTKQLCSRIIEPFGYAKILVTATEWKNFFELRCPQYKAPENSIETKDKIFKSKKDMIQFYIDNDFKIGAGALKLWTNLDWLNANQSQAEIHIQALAEAMWDAMNESKPKELEAGEWHIPFGDNISVENCFKAQPYSNKSDNGFDYYNEVSVKIATARAARLSYMTFDGEIDYEKDIQLHDRLLESKHASPMEHCARAMSEEEYYSFVKGKSNANWDTDLVTDNTYEISAQFDHNVLGWCNNFRGWIQYRYLIENSL